MSFVPPPQPSLIPPPQPPGVGGMLPPPPLQVPPLSYPMAPQQTTIPPPPPPPLLHHLPLPPVQQTQHQTPQTLPPPPPPPSLGVRGSTNNSNQQGSFQILFTSLPKILHNNRTLRDWLGASMVGGSIRNIVFVPPFKRDGTSTQQQDGNVQNKMIEPIIITALATMSNAESALKIFASFRHCKTKVLQQYSSSSSEVSAEGEDVAKPESSTGTTAPAWFNEMKIFNAHPVPAHPDIPLPPAILDPATTQILGDKLFHSYMNYFGTKAVTATTNNSLSVNNNENYDPVHKSSTTATEQTAIVLDGDKTAAAAGGYYDTNEDEDPLNAPAVLEAVQKFRQHLEKLQGTKATRRKALVQTKLYATIAKLRANPVKQQQRQPENHIDSSTPMQQQQQNQLPQPPPPLPTIGPDGVPLVLLPQPPLPPQAAALPRGVSNLPAWMTQQQQQQQIEEPQPKRVKTDSDINVPENTSPTFVNFPPIVDPSSIEQLRTFIAKEIKQLLGEEEATLIEFIHQHIVQQKSVQSLLPDLEQVLEEDAAQFLDALQRKSMELSSST